VKAAQIPISEVCQRALLAAVEAAETGGGRLEDALAGQAPCSSVCRKAAPWAVTRMSRVEYLTGCDTEVVAQ
jgi:hypothetical protein